jgi:hypothetical protein
VVDCFFLRRILFGVRVVIIFSMRFKMVLNRGWRGPRAVSI